LINAGVNVNKQTDNGETVLRLAFVHAYGDVSEKIIQTLIDAGAKLDDILYDEICSCIRIINGVNATIIKNYIIQTLESRIIEKILIDEKSVGNILDTIYELIWICNNVRALIRDSVIKAIGTSRLIKNMKYHIIKKCVIKEQSSHIRFKPNSIGFSVIRYSYDINTSNNLNNVFDKIRSDKKFIDYFCLCEMTNNDTIQTIIDDYIEFYSSDKK
jgi:hypothetical protein